MPRFYGKLKNFCYYFYRIAIRFLLIRLPLFFIFLPFALLMNARRGHRPGESR
ncbi:MAG: hypothetical protein LBI77_03280 [Puniceicoccales bacterium]|nr:hypothetical protein [Puniceicoccales bacterium]